MRSPLIPDDPDYYVRLSPDTLGTYASEGKWTAYPHLQYISERIMEAVRKGGGRLLVSMPPREGKSFLIARWAPAWFLENYPEESCIVAAHGDKLATKHGRWIRNQFQNNPLLRTKVSPDSKAADSWMTTAGGTFAAIGVGTGSLGTGGMFNVVDDPYPNWAAAYSHSYRTMLWDWWQGTFLSRLEPGATIVVLHHRMHPDDLIAQILRGEDGAEWTHISLPAIAEPGDPLKRPAGTTFSPGRFDLDHYAKKERAVGPHKWAAMYQQHPKGIGAGLVYQSFDESHVDPKVTLDPRQPLAIMFDFNINPGMHCLIGQYSPLADQFVFRHEIHGERMNLKQCLAAIDELVKAQGGWKWPDVRIYGDASGSQHQVNTGTSALALIMRHFDAANIEHTMLVPASNGPVTDGVAAFNDALLDGGGERHVRIHPDCVRLLADMRELRLDADGQIDKSKRKLGHASDAGRYWITFERPAGGTIAMPEGRFGV